MKKNIVLAVVALIAMSFFSTQVALTESRADMKKQTLGAHVEGEMMVKFKPDVGKDVAEKSYQEKGCQLIHVIDELGIYRLKIPQGKTVLEMVALFQKDPRVKWAEPVYIPSV